MSIRPYLADCGVRTTNAKSQVVKVAEAKGKFVITLEGKQIGRYWCAPPEVAVRLDTDARVFLGRDHKYQNAKFLIRQTAAYPIAGPREHATHFRNSLHALYAPDGDLDVRYLVGLLNSKLLRFAYVTTIREASQRVFPQVKLGPLGTLPIRALDLNRRRAKEARPRGRAAWMPYSPRNASYGARRTSQGSSSASDESASSTRTSIARYSTSMV